jgi:hypothetical protein
MKDSRVAEETVLSRVYPWKKPVSPVRKQAFSDYTLPHGRGVHHRSMSDFKGGGKAFQFQAGE